nr:hypothetical protein [Tanacetum cinerariifolium]
MARLAFCDYHNMIDFLEKYEQNTDFHAIVDFVEASYLRIETTEEGTKILATVDGKLGTISESSIRRNLKLNDEAGISSLPDAELFENLTLMGYNISPNQKFTFQKGQFNHQWKYLIHTIMQCLSPKIIGFNEFNSNIATALVCLATNRIYNFSKMIFDGMVRNVNNKVSKFLMYPRFLSKCLKMGQFGQITHTHTYVVPFHTRKIFSTLRVNSPSFSGRTVPLFPSMLVTMGEGSGTTTEPYHTPSPEAQQTSPTTHSSPSLPPSSALPPVADKHASPIRDDSQGEDCPNDSGLEADQDSANIPKTSTFPIDSTPRVTSLTADEGSMQQKLDELTALCTNLQRQQSEMIFKFAAQELEINRLKARIKLLEDKDRGVAEQYGDDAPIKGMKQLKDGVVSTASPTIPTASPIFTTATESTPYTRRKGWKARHFKGMTLEEIKEKFDPVWKQFQDFIPIGSNEEAERFKRKAVPVEEVYVEALQVKHPIIDWKVHTEGHRSYWKIIRLGGSSASYQFFVDMLKHLDREDLNQLWTLVKETLNIRPASIEWKLYDTCRVHHVTSKDKQIFMLVEKDYPLRKGLAIVMISYKLQVENYSQMANDLILKIYKIANCPRQQDD